MELKDLKKLLKEYKEELNCKYPDSNFSEENYKELSNKDILQLQLFEYIIDYLEEKELKDSGYYD